jgi:hypothetical protein
MSKRHFHENGGMTSPIQTADIVWLQGNFSSGPNPIYLKRTRSADTAYGGRPVGVPIHHTADENGSLWSTWPNTHADAPLDYRSESGRRKHVRMGNQFPCEHRVKAPVKK